jgi:hypothetical protein
MLVRHRMERLEPATYWSLSYFERWAAATELLSEERGIVTQQEVDARVALLLRDPHYKPRAAKPRPKPHHPPSESPTAKPPVTGMVLPPEELLDIDENSNLITADLAPLYFVEFTGTEVWGAGAEPNTKVCAEVHEKYLE